MASACFCTTGSALVRAFRLKTDSTPVTAMTTTTMNTSSSITLRPRSSVDIAGLLLDEHVVRPAAVDLDVELGSKVHRAPAGIEVERWDRASNRHPGWCADRVGLFAARPRRRGGAGGVIAQRGIAGGQADMNIGVLGDGQFLRKTHRGGQLVGKTAGIDARPAQHARDGHRREDAGYDHYQD